MDQGIVALIVAGFTLVSSVTGVLVKRHTAKLRRQHEATIERLNRDHASKLADADRSHLAALESMKMEHQAELQAVRLKHEVDIASRDPDRHRALHERFASGIGGLAKIMEQVNYHTYRISLNSKSREEGKISGDEDQLRFEQIKKERAPLEAQAATARAELSDVMVAMKGMCSAHVVTAARRWYDVANAVKPGDAKGYLNYEDDFWAAARAELGGAPQV